jgi:group II intron reverse transcriptase/maturase
MKNDCRKSDRLVVPEKSSNKLDKVSAERMEGRGLPKENKRQQNMLRTQYREGVLNKLQLIHQKAKADKKMKFTTLMHHIYNIDMLRMSYLEIKRNAAPGVDRETWESYGKDLEKNLKDLSERLKCGAYRAKPVRRVYIPKTDGKLRPLGVSALEDKIAQRAAVAVMNTIYEADFEGFSYGFRPKRSQHQALDALYVGISTKKVNYVFDADIRDFFNKIDREWLIKFIEHRIADKRVVRLIQKWLNAGIFEEGKIIYNEQGTTQGSSVSPLLANVFLHYVYDLWIKQWRKQKARGDVIVIRFADDTVVGFQHELDAKHFQEELKERLLKFRLELHPEKTRLIEFGRYAAERRKKREEEKPETFTFLGFTHICGKRKRDGKFEILRQTIKKRMRAKISEIKDELKKRMHDPIQELGQWLRAVVMGHYRYFGVPGNYDDMNDFRNAISENWIHVLRRRGQKGLIKWEKMRKLIDYWLPRPQICHKYPNERFGVTI